MVDHRRTPSQRAYQLPSWFFVLTVLLGVLALAAVGWAFLGDRFDTPFGARQPAAAPSASEPEPEPEPATSRPPSGPTADGEGDEGGDEPGADERRPDIGVIVLNASETPGLARGIAATAKESGWTIAEVGNWIYPAVVNAVYYPDGRQAEAEQLSGDISVESVRPARPGMSTDALTVLLVSSP
jgi:hypothetical protein